MTISIKQRCLSLAIVCSSPALAITPVDVELQLLLDISGSINSQEYDLQLQGYANAFKSDSVQNAIINGTQGSIAVQLIMWSGSNQQEVMIDWSLVDSTQAADDLSDVIASLARPFAGWTGIGSAIEYAYPLFNNNNYSGTTNVIDISGDGTNNTGVAPATARQNALNNGVDTINGIVITGNQAVIDQYVNDVVGGEDPFLLAPANFDDFQLAIENKIAAEIAGTQPVQAIKVSEPSPLYFMVFTIIYLFCKRTRVSK